MYIKTLAVLFYHDFSTKTETFREFIFKSNSLHRQCIHKKLVKCHRNILFCFAIVIELATVYKLFCFASIRFAFERQYNLFTGIFQAAGMLPQSFA